MPGEYRAGGLDVTSILTNSKRLELRFHVMQVHSDTVSVQPIGTQKVRHSPLLGLKLRKSCPPPLQWSCSLLAPHYGQ